MQFRHINSLGDLIDQNLLAAFMSEEDANTVRLLPQLWPKAGATGYEIIIDKRRPVNSIEVYFRTEEEEFKKRIEEQKEFDKIFA